MRIATFSSTDAPESERWHAYWYRPTRNKAGVITGEERLPLVIVGRTKDVVIARAEAWWAKEQAKIADEAQAAAERAARRKRVNHG